MSPAKQEWTPELVASKLQGLGQRSETKAPSEVSPLHRAYREAAAVLSWFDPLTIRPFCIEVSSVGSPLPELLEESTHSTDLEGRVRWRLQHEIRGRTLRDLADRGALGSALEANPERPDDPLQLMLDAYGLGRPVPVEHQTEEQLAASMQLIYWLGESRLGLPKPRELECRLEELRFKDPLARRAGEHLFGRSADLQALREYVRLPRQDSQFQKPLLVYGPGGLGKSALLARFMLDELDLNSAERLSLVLLDFDRAGLTASEPLSLLIEAFHQIGIQHPSVRDRCESERLRLARSLFPAEGEAGDSADLYANEGLESFGFEQLNAVFLLARILEHVGVLERPLVLLLDTLEEVQYDSRESVGALWTFLEEMRQYVPVLRPVLAGRAQVEGLPYVALELEELDPEAAVRLLQAEGIQDAGLAAAVAQQVGGNPLSLKLAAAVTGRGGESDLGEIVAQAALVQDIREAQIQGQLYQRILGHIHDEEVRKLAHPGLVLRVITPDIIRRVLAEPCNVEVKTQARAEELFHELGNEAALVTREEGLLRHRADVRRVMIRLLKADQPRQVADIHSLAVAYYRRRGGAEARAEEIYHRLARGDDPRKVESRWPDGGAELQQVRALLGSAMEEFTGRTRAHLGSHLGLELDLETVARADLEDWERHTRRKVEDLITRGRVDRLEAALSLLHERTERTPASPLYLLEARALERLGRLQEARATVAIGIQSAAGGGDERSLMELYQFAAAIDQRSGQLDLALRMLEAAARIATRLADLPVSIQIQLDRLLVFERLGSGNTPATTEAREALVATIGRLSDEQLREHAVLATAAARLLALDYPQTADRIHVALDTRPAKHGQPIRKAYTQAEIETLRKIASEVAPNERKLSDLVERGLETQLRSVTRGGDVSSLVADVIDWAEISGEQTGLEAIILLNGRPALLIQNGRFFPPPREWEVLERHRESIERTLRSVGRIEIEGHLNLDWIGTGFLVSRDVVMTSRAVATEFTSPRADGRWGIKPGIRARIDFREEFGGGEAAEFEIRSLIGIHGRLDMALFRVSRKGGPDGTWDLPLPLVIAANPEKAGPLSGRDVYVVGYPAWDGRRHEPEAMHRLFSNIYNVKRLQPGRIIQHPAGEAQFTHDCSTMGGNSGSCVVDVETNRVLGLHVDSRYLQGNVAIALWELADDPLIRYGGIRIGE